MSKGIVVFIHRSAIRLSKTIMTKKQYLLYHLEVESSSDNSEFSKMLLFIIPKNIEMNKDIVFFYFCLL